MAVFLVTGIQAAGKSTVARGLAERLDRSVHVLGGLFRRMIPGSRRCWTPRIVLWLDTSELSVDETVGQIIARAGSEAAV